jgi:hypothetical protein
MISLKRNSKGALTLATGRRARESSIYKPGQVESFRVSRSKFSDFLNCARCFYLDRVNGLVSPSTPGWSLNETTDLLLKKEFDLCRERQIPHRIFDRFGLSNVVPFAHPAIDKWRDALWHGLEYDVPNSNIVLHGGIDDVWQDPASAQLIVVDYKSQANSHSVTSEAYLAGIYHQGYKVQMDFYAYLLVKMGFDVSPTSYFYVCNADRSVPDFGGRMLFEETLVPYAWDSNWIEPKLVEMIQALNSQEMPDSNPACENCAYARYRASLEY